MVTHVHEHYPILYTCIYFLHLLEFNSMIPALLSSSEINVKLSGVETEIG